MPAHAKSTAWKFRRRRAAVGGGVLLFILAAGGATKVLATALDVTTTTTTSTTTTTTTIPLNQVTNSPVPVVQRRLSLFKRIGGPISPKSVVSTNTGLVFAQNMMYRHTITVYNSNGALLHTISDQVNLTALGVTGHPGWTRGAPVEAAVTPDGAHMWVSNYSTYGNGSGPEGSDTCTPSSAQAAHDTPSFLYRVSTTTFKIDMVAKVGLVPKYVAVTPDGRYVLATNWCSWNVFVIDATNGHTVKVIDARGAYPRGIAISPDSRYAYVAIMGGSVLDVIDLSTMKLIRTFEVGSNVRHVVIDPINGNYLYVSLNGPGEVEKINRFNGHVVARVHTGAQCRSLSISTDGTALFVVNYDSNTMTMLRASDLHILQNVATGTHPVGVTYDGTTGRVWVAVYTGEIMVFNTK